MGACLGKSLEVVAIDEVKAYIVPLILEEVRTKVIPQVIQALQMTEKELDSITAANIAADTKNNLESYIDEHEQQLHSTAAV